MLTQERCRVYGSSREGLEEDLCSKVELPVRAVVWCPRGTYIHVQLQEAGDIPLRLMLNWPRLEVHHNGQVFRLNKVSVGTTPIEAGNPTFVQEAAVALWFVPGGCLN